MMRLPLAAAFAASALVARPASAQEQGPGAQTAAEDVAGEIAIDVRDDASAADIADIAAKYGLATMHANSAWSDAHDKIEVADVDPASEAAILEALSHDPRVEHAEPMALYRASFVPNDPLYESKQWHLERVGAPRAWDFACGAGITVAVIDTGVACFDKGPFSRGTDLAGTRCEGGYNFIDNRAAPSDDHGHGTHVAGTIAQTTNNAMGAAGLAYCATLMPIKALTKQGFGTVANVAESIRFAADGGAQIVNLSLGGPIKSRILEDAVDHALAKGVVVVAAAGNSGRSVGWPAAYPGVVAVSATDSNDRIAPFSSRGPEIVLAAPGVAVTQQTVCNGGRDRCEIFGTFSGTSMASPHVAGVAAIVASMGVTDAGALTDALRSSARLPDRGEPKLYGSGIVDAAAASRHVFWNRLAVRGIALGALWWIVVRRIRKRGGRPVRSLLSVAGALASSVGLIALAAPLGVAPRAGRFRWAVDLASRPLGEWDLALLGAGVHRWLLLASALPVLGLAALCFASTRLRPLVGGVALGTAALLAQLAWTGDAAFTGGPFLARAWAIGNALVCLWLARVALQR